MSVYVPLPHTGEYIRLLKLGPGNLQDDLIAEFFVHNLNDAQPEYTATSYVCGDDDRCRHHITMSGTNLGIYKNADEVLRRFRSETDATYLWIDVCCIDQDDPVEKAKEVSLMWKTYKHARRTVVWLGPADANSTAAIQYARSLDASRYLKEFRPFIMYGGQNRPSKSLILDELTAHPQKESLTNSCAEFLLRPYFTRLWCQQEGSLSSEPVVVCGEDEIPWNQVFALAWLFEPRYTMLWPSWFLPNYPNGYAELEPNLGFIQSVQEYRLAKAMDPDVEAINRAFSLVRIMHDASRFRCYDPRDKIYALRNIASDWHLNDWAPQPDYVTPWEEVYTNFAVILAGRADRQILDYSGICQQGDQVGDNSGLPSWVVDWRSRPWQQYLHQAEWKAGGTTFRTKAEIIPKKKRHALNRMLQAANQPRKSLRYALQITVMMQDSISCLSGVVGNPMGLEDGVDLRKHYKEVLALDQVVQAFVCALPHPNYITSERALHAYNTTLIANTTDTDTIASPEYISDGAEEWRSWLSCGANPNNNTIPRYHDAIDNVDTFRFKHFCVSSAGYFCLVPHITDPRDTIAIVKGIDMPIVLRPVGEYYVYLGQCFIHGMMMPKAGELIEEFLVMYDSKESKVVIRRPDGEIRRNGRKMDAGEYVRILGTLGERRVELI
ncbi:hypothetical protein H2200_005153 [Cladophialophora chaetospira]|uniref:Heterokaryon incompatibility domain-containing protein n=1 Tax=Cladophialophora chaetospira TaxID=386627 RepID=A0AA38XC18_9EURO|nr:hypothetical protein H2200_005153 [Cladophialophora chaetospira]